MTQPAVLPCVVVVTVALAVAFADAVAPAVSVLLALLGTLAAGVAPTARPVAPAMLGLSARVVAAGVALVVVEAFSPSCGVAPVVASVPDRAFDVLAPPTPMLVVVSATVLWAGIKRLDEEADASPPLLRVCPLAPPLVALADAVLADPDDEVAPGSLVGAAPVFPEPVFAEFEPLDELDASPPELEAPPVPPSESVALAKVVPPEPDPESLDELDASPTAPEVPSPPPSESAALAPVVVPEPSSPPEPPEPAVAPALGESPPPPPDVLDVRLKAPRAFDPPPALTVGAPAVGAGVGMLFEAFWLLDVATVAWLTVRVPVVA